MEAIFVFFAMFCCCLAAPQLAPITVPPFESCVLPTTQYCAVNYLVPPSIAQMAPVLEAKIQTAYNSELQQGNSEACARSLREVRCARNFPRCSNDSTNVTVTSLDCQQRLQCATSQTINRLNAEYFCSLSQSTVSNGAFKSATDYGYTFKYCAVDASWEVTEWMFLLLKYEDSYLSSTNVLGAAGFLSQNYPSCSSGYANYECRTIGQCDKNGHVSVNFTRQQCEQAVSCYPDGYVDNTPCSLWPKTTTPPTTGPTTSAPATTTYAKQTVPMGGTMTFALGSAARGLSLSTLTKPKFRSFRGRTRPHHYRRHHHHQLHIT
eukprot:Em0013g1105a